MINVPHQLRETADKVHAGERTRAIKLRSLLNWFGAQRRGANVCVDIRGALKKVRLVTEPDFATVNIEGLVRFKPAMVRGRNKTTATKPSSTSGVGASADEEIKKAAEIDLCDPTPRIGTVFELKKPVAVTRNDSLEKAVTIMANRDFSQLPVMNGDRHVDGIVSWRSIGDAIHVHKKACSVVGDCIETDGYDVVPSDCSLPKALKTLAGNDLVLVKDETNKIIGIVTHADIAEKYHELAEPFLLIGEIENNLRQLIRLANFTTELIIGAKNPADKNRKVESVSDLTFGEYVQLLDDSENWKKVHLGLSRSEFMKEIKAVNKIRNEVMHFDPDPLEKEKLETLKRTAKMMRGFKLFSKKATAASQTI